MYGPIGFLPTAAIFGCTGFSSVPIELDKRVTSVTCGRLLSNKISVSHASDGMVFCRLIAYVSVFFLFFLRGLARSSEKMRTRRQSQVFSNGCTVSSRRTR